MDPVLLGMSQILLTTPGVVAKTAGRIYQTHVSLVPEPGYPCITLHRDRPGDVDQAAPIMEQFIVMTAHSQVDVDEADTLSKVAMLALDRVNGSAWWVLRLLQGPYDSIDDMRGTIFRTHVTFCAHQTLTTP